MAAPIPAGVSIAAAGVPASECPLLRSGTGAYAIYEQGLRAADEKLRARLESAMETVREALRRYGPQSVAVSFNGGKDCTVLVFLLVAALDQLSPARPEIRDRPVKALYVTSDNPFPEIDAFVEFFAKMFGLDLMEILGRMKPALERFLDSNRIVKAILVGTRRTDPYASKLESFSATDNGWPPVMRVHPLLDWDYDDVWGAIRVLRLPYCSLYDHGFTSIGSMSDTAPNPLLKSADAARGFLPAHMLKDGAQERSGRLSK
ncbi:3'-phosphoadenosine 5'-phosphosulfate sulfotransferase [Polyrhizophydium stewartii]|uniref:FAD synthase n=1 Tax=Polyrhizophydium stewartii TaxID=2732419 RepID=A0ABR4NFH3_9FUNG|nr:3'-phosphoadenosine 5'-phosphosulfate sulfotransferase [Polyrhizophydium stewartii]